MLGSTLASDNVTGAFGSFAAGVPDAVTGVVTCALRNNDNFGSVYGLRGALTDHVFTIRNVRESPRAGFPLMTRHSIEYAMTTREVVSAGIVTNAIPYFATLVMRLPSTGSGLVLATMASSVVSAVLMTQGLKAQKMFNFES
jgi:hypothetical protein